MALSGSTETVKTKEIMTTWQAVWAFLNSRLFLIILIVLLLLVGLGEYRRIVDLKQDVARHEQNNAALTDSLHFERSRNGDLTASISGYIASEKELKDLNRELYDKVKKQEGQILTLTNTVVTMKQDSASLAGLVDSLNVVIGELKKDGDKYTAPWSIAYKFDEKNGFKVVGSTVVQVTSVEPFQMRHDTTYLREYENRIALTYGQKVEDDKLRVFIQSNYPGFSVEAMEGVLIDPNDWPQLVKPSKRHWFTGFGVGPNITMGYDFVNAKPGLLLGVGIQYNIYQW